jgi:hypothetical protein
MLATEISSNVVLTQEPITHFKTKVWEDNAGALKLATIWDQVPLVQKQTEARQFWYHQDSKWWSKFEANRKLTLGW